MRFSKHAHTRVQIEWNEERTSAQFKWNVIFMKTGGDFYSAFSAKTRNDKKGLGEHEEF